MSEPLSREVAARLRLRMWEEDVKQGEIAIRMAGMDGPRLSRILNGKERPPEGFERRFLDTVDAILAARGHRALAAVGTAGEESSR